MKEPRTNAARAVLALSAVALLGACAPKPQLYPNPHLQSVGREQADLDVAECKALASEYVRNDAPAKAGAGAAVGGAAGGAIGAAGGAVRGRAGRGAAIGAATGATGGFLRGLFRSGQNDPVYRNFVGICLRERGYRVIGWR